MSSRRPPGRPSKLDDRLADRLAALLGSGSTVTAAAETLGVSPRSIQLWRRRAWSREPSDARFVRLEKAIQQAVASRAPVEPPAPPWEELAARLELEFPDRWRLDPVLDDDFFDEPAA